VVGDVCHEDDCGRIVAEAVDGLGGPLDLVVYAAGVSPLVRTERVTRADWLRALDVNTIGASLLFGACVSNMAEDGMIAYLSSEAIGKPRHGGIVYQASKAAMQEALHVFRAEHPEIRFVTVVVGPTVGTEIAVDRDVVLMAELVSEWVKRGLLRGGFMEAAALGQLLVDVLAPVLAYPPADMTDLTLTATGPLLDDISSIMANQADARRRALDD
jgi:NAD(P)-dependent dehydrogenase (short-subunit alcohol dehydrogenase family)